MLVVKKVSHTYPGSARPALREVGFRVGMGEIVGIVGPAGAGKSALVRILAGLIRTYEGEVEFEGRELKVWSRDYFEQVGVCLGGAGHFLKLTAAENLAHFAGLYAAGTEPVAAVLESVGLASEADRRVAGFPEEMKTRLALARAVLHRPMALFLDEPLAGVDPGQAARLRELIVEQKKSGRAILVATRDRAVAEGLCDRVESLSEGRLAEGGAA